MYFVYVLYSASANRRYIGQTQDIELRIQKHNAAGNPSTKFGVPWQLLAFKPVESRSDALALERKLKNLKSAARQDLFFAKNNFNMQEVIGPETTDS